MLSAASVGKARLEQNAVAIYSLLSFCSAHYWRVGLHDTLPTSPKAVDRLRCGRHVITQYLYVTEQSSWLCRCDVSLLRTFHVNTQYYALNP